MGVVSNPKNTKNGQKTMTISNSGSSEMNFYIEYNPYINETKFLINGKPASGKFDLYQREFRLQQYIEPREGWEGLFAEILKKCNSEHVKVTFKGRTIDFDDLKICLEDSGYKNNIELDFISAKNDNDIISDIGKIISKLSDTDIDELKDNDKIKNAYNDALNSQLKVSVIATMSSGKSTLINALLGDEMLPSQNQACTATIARILDNDNMDYFNCVCKNKDENELNSKDHVTKADLEEFNRQGNKMANDDPQKIVFMDMEGPIPGISAEKVRLLLQDTPGPNNSQDTKHKALTEDMIKNKKNSVILYVMNATQLSVDDDYKLLDLVSTAMKDGGKQTRDRFIFVVNKFDSLDLEKEDANKTIEATREYLKEFGIEQPNIFPVSAYAALLFRKKELGKEMSRKEAQDCSGYLYNFSDPEFTPSHFEKLADLSPSVKKKLEKRLETADELETALIHTGIPAIEETINEYLEKYAYPIKVNDAVNELQTVVRELDMVRRFNDSIVNNTEKREQLKAQINAAEVSQGEAKGYKDSFKRKIDEFELDSSSKTGLLRSVNIKINELKTEFGVGDEVDESEAYSIMRSFQRSVERIQDKYESDLKAIVEREVKSKGNKMSAEYSEVVTKLFNDIKIDGFEFSDIKDINKYMISDMDSLIRKNKRSEDITESYQVDNPERSGFFGFFKFWKPKKITKTRVVGTRTYVNIANIISIEMANIFSVFEVNINEAFNKASQEISNYKKIFKRNLDGLDVKIQEIIHDMRTKLENIHTLENEINRNKTKLEEIENLASNISKVMEF